MFSTKLKELRKQRGLSQADLAAELEMSKSTISMYENGQRKPKYETIEMFADFFNVDIAKLLDTRRSRPNYVPIIGAIACGSPILAVENIEEYVPLPKDVVADFCLRCAGDSMINARINDGDLVYIRQQPDVDDGQIAAVLIGEETTLKRVYKRQDTLILRPANPLYEDMIFVGPELNDIEILGRAVAFTGYI